MKSWIPEWFWTVLLCVIIVSCCGPCAIATFAFAAITDYQDNAPDVILDEGVTPVDSSEVVPMRDSLGNPVSQPPAPLSRSVPVLGGTVVVPVGPSTFEGRQGIVPTLPPSVD